MSDWKNAKDGALETAPESEEELGELFREAGPRPAPPAADLAAIRGAVREEWRRAHPVAGSATRWSPPSPALALAAGLALALGAAWWWANRAPTLDAPVVATVDLARGDVRVTETATPGEGAAAAGESLTVGARIETGDEELSGVALRLGGGQSARLKAGTTIVLAAANRLELVRGTLYVDSGGDGAPTSGVEVITRVGTVRDVGTQFEVHVDDGEASVLRVRVREGAISLSNGGTHEATAGEELLLEEGGGVSRGTVPRTGASWDWIQRVAPGLDIEGASLIAYLDWVGRETGLEVGFSSSAVEASAAAVRLHGTIEGLTPEESLSVVLPGSGLGWEVDERRLTVAARTRS